MKHTVRKIFFNFEKEEKWLNEMAAKGLNLIHYSWGKYLFEKGEPGEYIYRLELLEELPSNIESKNYIEFMEESGVQCVSIYMRWVFFRKKASEGEFNLYSDYDCKIKHYKRIIYLLGSITLGNLAAVIVNLCTSILSNHTTDYKSVYYGMFF